jgi:hypothetical protein
VIERGRGPGLLFEPLDAHGVAGEIGGQKLQSHFAPEAQLGGKPHLAHASRTDKVDDFVGAEPCTGLKEHASANYTRGEPGHGRVPTKHLPGGDAHCGRTIGSI